MEIEFKEDNLSITVKLAGPNYLEGVATELCINFQLYSQVTIATCG